MRIVEKWSIIPARQSAVCSIPLKRLFNHFEVKKIVLPQRFLENSYRKPDHMMPELRQIPGFVSLFIPYPMVSARDLHHFSFLNYLR
jgi:hypothetical protein